VSTITGEAHPQFKDGGWMASGDDEIVLEYDDLVDDLVDIERKAKEFSKRAQKIVEADAEKRKTGSDVERA
jgi:hypothetical protein